MEKIISCGKCSILKFCLGKRIMDIVDGSPKKRSSNAPNGFLKKGRQKVLGLLVGSLIWLDHPLTQLS